LKLVLPFCLKKIVILVSPETLQKQIIALSTVSDYKIGWFTDSNSEPNPTPQSTTTNYSYNKYHPSYNNIHDHNNNYTNNGYNNYNPNYNNNNNSGSIFGNFYDYKKRKLNETNIQNPIGNLNSNSKTNSNNDVPVTFETCWDIVNFIVNNYAKEALLLTPMQFKYLLDIGLLSFNTNINLLVIDHCQSIQNNKVDYSFFSKIMTNYNESIKNISINNDFEEKKDKDNKDNNQKVKKKRRLNSGEQKSCKTRIVGVVDRVKENKRINISNLEEFYQCQMVWADNESNSNLLSLTASQSPETDVNKKLEIDTQLQHESDEENKKVDILNKKNNKEYIDLNNVKSIFFTNETIINYHQCIDVDWSIYDEQVKLEQQKQKKINPQDNFFHQQFKIPSILFIDMEKANINDRFKILLITYLKLMEFLVKKMSWLNDYKNLENTKRLIKLIKNEYKELGLWCACNLARIYVENLYQTFCYHIIKEDYELLLSRHYQYTQHLLKHFDFEDLNNNQFLSPKVVSIIERLSCHMKKINQKKVF